MDSTYITYGAVRSAVVAADNGSDPERRYDIAAELSFRDGALVAAGNGRVTDRDSGRTLASFGEGSDGSLWLDLGRPDGGSADVLGAIRDFTEACRGKAAAHPPAVV